MKPIATTMPVTICNMKVEKFIVSVVSPSPPIGGRYAMETTIARPMMKLRTSFQSTRCISAFLMSIGTEPKTRPKKKNIETTGKSVMMFVIGPAHSTMPSRAGMPKLRR